MERLTKRKKLENGLSCVDCAHIQGQDCKAVRGRCSSRCRWKEEAWKRLADYEDTGLTPEEIEDFDLVLNETAIVKLAAGYLKTTDDNLREITQAEKDGRLLVLPCKVVDTVYRVFHPRGRDPVIAECEIKTTCQAADLIGRIGKKSFLKRNVDGLCANFYDEHGYYCGAAKPTYQPGDILYVRETWATVDRFSYNFGDWWSEYIYRATYRPDPKLDVPIVKWRPSIHMPREAARIFLRVTDVRVERLQDITYEQSIAEGAKDPYDYQSQEWYDEFPYLLDKYKIAAFAGLWDSTVKPADLDLYGWAANPWVWIYKYERISREEAERG